MTIGLKANNDGSAAIQVNGTDRVTLTSAGVMSVPAGVTADVTGDVTGNASSATQLSTASGSAPSYAARAWVNFNGSASETFAGGSSTVSRTAGSTTATITTTNDHGLITGNSVYALTGVVAGAYTVTVTGLKTFTITTVATTVLTNAAITFAVNSIRASGNVSSITDLGVGTYAVNIATPLPDANYVISGCMNNSSLSNCYIMQNQSFANTTSVAYIYSAVPGGTADSTFCAVAIFR